MKKTNRTIELLKHKNYELDLENYNSDVLITQDNYGNIKISDYSSLSEIPYIEILKSKFEITENNVFYMDQYL